MLTRAFWLDVAERAIKTGFQALVPILAADGADLLHLDWSTSLGLAGTAAALSVFTSVASARVGDPGTASLVATGGRHTRG